MTEVVHKLRILHFLIDRHDLSDKNFICLSYLTQLKVAQKYIVSDAINVFLSKTAILLLALIAI